MRPSRLHTLKDCLEKFVFQYFDQNPISQLSLITTCDRSAVKLTELTGNPKHHLQVIASLGSTAKTTPKGVASIQSVLTMTIGTLRHIPAYGHREMLLVYNSLSTCDAGDIFKTIEEAKALKIRCSVICLSAEVYICHRLAQLTTGSFAVAMDAIHLKELIMNHISPPPELRNRPIMTAKFIYLGFPLRVYDQSPVTCQDGSMATIQAGNSFMCPRCKTKNTQLPVQCQVCGLQLYSSSHIARSFHHMFPVPNFTELEVDVDKIAGIGDGVVANGTSDVPEKPIGLSQEKATTETSMSAILLSSHSSSSISIRSYDQEGKCCGCNTEFPSSTSLKLSCPKCSSIFCAECDIFIHDSLHNCPGCC